MNKHDKMNSQRGIVQDTTKSPILSKRFIIYVGYMTQGVVWMYLLTAPPSEWSIVYTPMKRDHQW